MSQTERAPRQSKRLAEELIRLPLLTALPERVRQVGRRRQRALVLRAEQVGLLDEDLTLDLRGLGVLALAFERGRQVAGRGEHLVVFSTEHASHVRERVSTTSSACSPRWRSALTRMLFVASVLSWSAPTVRYGERRP